MEKVIGYTQGTFDMFHIGHLNLIKNAKRHCDYLVVGVNSDDLVESYKNKRPIIPLDERVEIMRAIKYVDEVIVTNTLDKKEIWEKVRFNEIYIGDDWKGNERWEKTGKEMEQLGAKLVFLPYTKDTSSTMLREKLKEF
ncbi:glycerol-3-phosphate cytidylyltransferase [Ruminococcus sp. AF41-9]|nr:glycerol-3-phosphate cytidylyltransferase [Ruminococcus sp. AF41-9]